MSGHIIPRPLDRSALTPADLTQLVNFWFTRKISRPVRRRMIEAGALWHSPFNGELCLTREGLALMLEKAPRSPWSPPKNDADSLIMRASPEQRRTMPAYQAALVSAILAGASFHTGRRGGR